MRRLLLFRHAKSSRPPGVEDHDRPLAGRGRRDSEAMGRFMAEQGLRPDLVLVSSSRRTQETWARAAPAFGLDVPALTDRRLYAATPESLLAIIRHTSNGVRTLMLVGHNPELEMLSLELIGEGRPPALSELRKKFPTAALAVIAFEIGGWADVSPTGGRLEHFAKPKSLG